MIFASAYNIGDIFYSPRSKMDWQKECRVIGDEEWYKENEVLVPEVKTLRISEIHISQEGTMAPFITYHAHVKYDTQHYGERDADGFITDEYRSYTEERLVKLPRDYDQAKQMAIDYAVHQKIAFTL